MRKRVFTFLLPFLFVNCVNKEIDLKGDWYTGTTKKSLKETVINDSHNFVYEEYHITENMIFKYQNLLGYSFPLKYEISNDSLFVSGLNPTEYEFSGVIKRINKNKFSLKIDNHELEFFRLNKVNNTLGKFIKKTDETRYEFVQEKTEYTQGFIVRSEKHHTSIK